jgi:hypothetical protein
VFSIGVDLGQAADYSTVAVVRSVGDDLHLVHLHRFPLGTDYTVVVDGIVDFYEDDRLGEGGQPPLLTLDETGVGRAISDLLLSTHTPFYAVTITAGGTARPYASRGARVSWRVPKTTLVEALEQPFRLGNLKVANGLHWGEALVEELRYFRRKVNPKTAHVRYEHDRAGDKDDLVLASALACWRSKAGVGLAG